MSSRRSGRVARKPDTPEVSGDENNAFQGTMNNYFNRRFMLRKKRRFPPNSEARAGPSDRRSRSTDSSSSGAMSDEEEEEQMYVRRTTKNHLHTLQSFSKRSHMRSNTKANNSQVNDGIRRSTRQRKLKYDNYNDSWIFDAQSLPGYPSLKKTRETRMSLRAVKEEQREKEHSEEEQSEGEPTTPANFSKANLRLRRTPKIKIEKESEDRETSSDGENEVGKLNDDKTFKDMYTRVKRRRERNIKEENAGDAGESSDFDSSLEYHSKKPESRVRNLPQTRHSEQRFKVEDSVEEFESSSERPVERRTLRSRNAIRTSARTKNQNNRRSVAESVEKKKYHLRKITPAVKRFQIDEGRTARKVKRRRSSSTSSSSSSSSNYSWYKDRKKSKSRNRKELANSSATRSTGRLADVDPLSLDTSIRFANVGGLESHIACLKEMVLLPILYPEVFSKFGVTPPKGVLFHGPPGTGKTHLARALANECSQGDRKVSFFMRKGADCLAKWVGESERQLRLLFEEAQAAKPSIIFFDELDGLAPVRSMKQDQIHASIVCTLLALMDGLDNRGDVLVIGATNRIDSIDPALRRPGRFDRELHFPLPSVKERREILAIHAKGWADNANLNHVAEITVGYCGSDLKALCTEAVIQSLKRVYPQVYSSTRKLLLDATKVEVKKIDFEKAFHGIVPASKRAVLIFGSKLPAYLDPLLSQDLATCLRFVMDAFPPALDRTKTHVQILRASRFLICGELKAANLLASGLLYKLEHCPVSSVSLEALYSDSNRSPEEYVIQVFKELPHLTGSILWFGDILNWWNFFSDTFRSVLQGLIAMTESLPILFLAVAPTYDLPDEVKSIFSNYREEVHHINPPTKEQKEAFFRPLFRIRALRPPVIPKRKDEYEPLPLAPPPPPPKLSQEELNDLYEEEENTLRELRIFLRQICSKLAANKQFYMFSKPVDVEEVPDYLQIIKEPMDLETMMTKIDLHKYTCAQEFLNDIDLICKNALEYNPIRNPGGILIRHRACYLRDTAYALIKAEMDSDFEVNCRTIRDARKARGMDNPSEKFVQEFFTPDNPEQEEESAPSTSKVAEKNPSGQPPKDSVSPLSPVVRKRKKRCSAWSKGQLMKKPKVNVNWKPNTTPSTPGPNSTVDDLSTTTTPNGLRSPLRTPMSNSPSDSETTHKETLIVDKEDLMMCLAEVGSAVDNIDSFKILIDLYDSLNKVINLFSKTWDRSDMTKALRAEIEKFVAYYADRSGSSSSSRGS